MELIAIMAIAMMRLRTRCWSARRPRGGGGAKEGRKGMKLSRRLLCSASDAVSLATGHRVPLSTTAPYLAVDHSQSGSAFVAVWREERDLREKNGRGERKNRRVK